MIKMKLIIPSGIKKIMTPMAITEDNIDEDIYETAKRSIDHTKEKT